MEMKRTLHSVLAAAVVMSLGTAAFGQGTQYWQFEDDFSADANANDALGTADLVYLSGTPEGTRSIDHPMDPVPNPDDGLSGGLFDDDSDPKDNAYSVGTPRFWRKTELFKVLDTASWTFEGWFKRDEVNDVETIASTHNEWTDDANYAWQEG
jgi:hypothetical protein